MSDDVKPGDRVRVRSATGEWFETTARSIPHLNRGLTGRNPPWMVVSVDHPGFGHPVNWPVQDVERLEP